MECGWREGGRSARFALALPLRCVCRAAFACRLLSPCPLLESLQTAAKPAECNRCTLLYASSDRYSIFTGVALQQLRAVSRDAATERVTSCTSSTHPQSGLTDCWMARRLPVMGLSLRLRRERKSPSPSSSPSPPPPHSSPLPEARATRDGAGGRRLVAAAARGEDVADADDAGRPPRGGEEVLDAGWTPFAAAAALLLADAWEAEGGPNK